MATRSTSIRTLEEVLVINGTCSDLQGAQAEMAEMAERVAEGEDPEEVLFEYGLEPDYVFDLLEACV